MSALDGGFKRSRCVAGKDRTRDAQQRQHARVNQVRRGVLRHRRSEDGDEVRHIRDRLTVSFGGIRPRSCENVYGGKNGRIFFFLGARWNSVGRLMGSHQAI